MLRESYLGTMVPVKPLRSSRLEEELSISDLLPTSRGKGPVNAGDASWKWVSPFTPSNGKALPVSLTGLHPK